MSATKSEPVNTSAGLINSAQLAQAMHVSGSTVKTWVADGCPVAKRGKGRGSPNFFDIEEVRKWRGAKSGKLDPQAERARKDKASADGIEIRNQVMLGQLVDKDSLVEHWADMVGAARAKLLSLPTKLATVAVASNDLEEIQHGAEKLVREVLEELAGDPAPSTESMVATAELDGEPVGGQVPETESRSLGGAGPVEN